MNKYVGPHVSISGGVENAPINADHVGARGFALFTKNQRQWKSTPLTEDSIQTFGARLNEFNFTPQHILPHDSYLINIGSPEPEKRKKSLHAFIDEIRRVEQLGLLYLNFHPGSHLKLVEESECLATIAEGMNTTIAETDYATLVIEATAGQGTNVGNTFEQIAEIIDGVTEKERVGVCIDTCHIFAAGYELRTEEGYSQTMEHFARIIGFEKLKGMHLNDSKKGLGSRVDRHESLGKGELGLKPFEFIMNDPRLDDIPLVLETPNPELWPEEIQILYNMIEKKRGGT